MSILKKVYIPIEKKDITNHKNITLINIRGIDTFCTEKEGVFFTKEDFYNLLNDCFEEGKNAYLESSTGDTGMTYNQLKKEYLNTLKI